MQNLASICCFYWEIGVRAKLTENCFWDFPTLTESRENLEQDQNADWVLEQFRGNIIIDGCNSYEEYDWKRIEIPVTKLVDQTVVKSNLMLEVNGLCTRCNVIGKALKSHLLLMPIWFWYHKTPDKIHWHSYYFTRYNFCVLKL